jgi:hypothetical protein
MLVYFMPIWNILRPFSISHGHLVCFLVILYIFPVLGILYQEKAGNTAEKQNAANGPRVNKCTYQSHFGHK